MSFIEKKFNSELIKNDVYLIKMEKDGSFFWHFIKASAVGKQLLEKIDTKSQIDVNKFGEILESGWGVNPSDEARKKYQK